MICIKLKVTIFTLMFSVSTFAVENRISTIYLKDRSGETDFTIRISNENNMLSLSRCNSEQLECNQVGQPISEERYLSSIRYINSQAQLEENRDPVMSAALGSMIGSQAGLAVTFGCALIKGCRNIIGRSNMKHLLPASLTAGGLVGAGAGYTLAELSVDQEAAAAVDGVNSLNVATNVTGYSRCRSGLRTDDGGCIVYAEKLNEILTGYSTIQMIAATAPQLPVSNQVNGSERSELEEASHNDTQVVEVKSEVMQQ
jgi:hypothetical protein